MCYLPIGAFLSMMTSFRSSERRNTIYLYMECILKLMNSTLHSSLTVTPELACKEMDITLPYDSMIFILVVLTRLWFVTVKGVALYSTYETNVVMLIEQIMNYDLKVPTALLYIYIYIYTYGHRTWSSSCADGLAHKCAKPSETTMLTTKLDIFHPHL